MAQAKTFTTQTQLSVALVQRNSEKWQIS